MAFCSKCGKELAEGTQFCASCGTPVGSIAAAPMAKPAKEKVGNIRVCPSCGASIESFQGHCPSCGHELNNVEIVGSIQEFYNKLISTKKASEKLDLIKSFPVPNTKEDIIEFLILSRSMIKPNTNELPGIRDENSAWMTKVHQVQAKAKMVISDDPEAMNEVAAIIKQINQVEEITETAKKQNAKKRIFSKLAIGVAAVVVVIGLIVGFSTIFFGTTKVPSSVTVAGTNIEIGNVMAKYVKVVDQDYTVVSDLTKWRIDMNIQFELVTDFKAVLEAKREEVRKKRGWKDTSTKLTNFLVGYNGASLNADVLDAGGSKLGELRCGSTEIGKLTDWLKSAKIGDKITLNFYYSFTWWDKIPERKKLMAKAMAMKACRIDDVRPQAAVYNIDIGYKESYEFVTNF
ncbi:hypothetical protein AGMMS50267_10820 [Spirochaetia bacterium]|nr:hypothetical protein AGMMS50267_10820 [Spirochaetia bacterium]